MVDNIDPLAGLHEKSISHRENVERGATEVFGPYVEVKISLDIKS